MTQKTPAPKPKGTVFKSAAAPAFTPDRVASAFIEEGKRRNISVIGIQEAICAGLDESGLRVLANPVNPASQALPNDGDGFDHDSEGPLQQRGSQGWGTLECRMDPACSAGLFYDRLVNLDYANLAAHQAGWWIQQVQRSFDASGNNYQAQWPSAIAIYNRLASPTGIPQEFVDLAISIFKARIGDDYVYGGAFSPTNIKQGTDCSGMVDTILQAMTHGPSMQWGRHISTESWPYDYGSDLAAPIGTVGPYGTICAGDAQPGGGARQSAVPADAAAIIYLMHGGGGENSHVMINVNDGHGGWVLMETGGAHNDTGGIGQYASPNGPATPTNHQEWTDIWYLPGPVGVGGLDMDANQDAMLREVHGALFTPVSSQSPFRALGEDAIWATKDFPHNDDGMLHPQYVEWAAGRGDTVSLAVLQTLANGDITKYPDRVEDILLARQVLTRVQAGQGASGAATPGTPVPFPPTPAQPVTAPVAPVDYEPAAYEPAEPVKVPGTMTISGDQIMGWIKDALTIIGAIGTWATTAHGVLGQYLDAGAAGTAVPVTLAAATAISASHTVKQKKHAQKTVHRLSQMKAPK
jgi:hypothetical protein